MNGIDHNCPWCHKKDIYPNQYCSEFCRRHYIKWINELADSLDQLLFTGAPSHIEFNKFPDPFDALMGTTKLKLNF